jgi:uncharacterized protein (TIGR00255 family)
MRSMTGFGRGVADQGGVRATVDVRAVNHRFLDVKLRGTLAPAVEDAVTTRIRGALERGAIAVSVHVARVAAASAPRIDTAAAERAYVELAALAARLALPPPDLALVLAQPGVVNAAPGPAAEDAEPELRATLAALDAALEQLAAMRGAEGHALAAELRARLDELTAARAQIALHAAALPAHLARRLAERLARALDGTDAVDPQRLAQEIALLADRADVTEELVRLASHLDQARALVAADAPAGRRLDFLVQEIGRELNTIGSKSALAEITSLVVASKATLEKVREQVQNVE